MSIIELIDVYKKYNSKYILKSINLAIDKGDFVAITGPSGAGKTTLLNIISGIDKPTKGEVIVAGHKLSKMNENELTFFRRHYIGFVFQFFYLVPELTVIENVELALDLIYPESERIYVIERKIGVRTIKYRTYERAVKVLELVGLGPEYYNRFPDQLSGGEQQRVAIARAIANNPQILIADEPTGNLDIRTSQKISEIFHRINKELGKTLVVVTHDLNILRYANKVYQLEDGTLREGVFEK